MQTGDSPKGLSVYCQYTVVTDALVRPEVWQLLRENAIADCYFTSLAVCQLFRKPAQPYFVLVSSPHCVHYHNEIGFIFYSIYDCVCAAFEQQGC